MKFYILMVFITLIIATTTIAQDTSQWHLPDGAKRRLGKGEIGEIDYSPDGTKLAVASGIGIWIYDTQTGEELNFLKAPLMKSEETPWLFRIYSAINTIAFCPDGKTLISDIDGNDIGIWDVDTGTLLRKIITHADGVCYKESTPNVYIELHSVLLILMCGSTDLQDTEIRHRDGIGSFG